MVVTLYPPGSPYLNKDRVGEAEQYNMSPGRAGASQQRHVLSSLAGMCMLSACFSLHYRDARGNAHQL